MSSDSAAEVSSEICCANCGTAEIDDVKLKDCPGGCDLARYCSDDCQEQYSEEHEAICRERAVELRDEILFRQPESSYLGDCPICFLPIPLDVKNATFTYYFCCSKYICKGCNFTNQYREQKGGLKPKCPFCRKHVPHTQEEGNKILMKRATANDPMALREIGWLSYKKGDYGSAFINMTRAAESGDATAHYHLSLMYLNGDGVEKDEKMERYHVEEAAIAGHPEARHNLGCLEGQNGMLDRAVKHWIIAAKLGHDESLHNLKKWYKDGKVSKDDLASALRAHQAAVDAMKSPQREQAAAFEKWRRSRKDDGQAK